VSGWGLARELLHPLFSPHADRLRPHLCLRVLLNTPDGPSPRDFFVIVCLALAAAAAVALGGGLLAAVWEVRVPVAGGTAGPDWAAGVWLVETEGAWRPPGAGGRWWWRGGCSPDSSPERRPRRSWRMRWPRAAAGQRVGPVLSALLLLQGLSPVAWVLHRRWRLAREAACDDYAAQVVGRSHKSRAGNRHEGGRRAEEMSVQHRQDREAVAHLAWRARALEEGEGKPAAGAGAAAVVMAGVAVTALLLSWSAARDGLQCARRLCWGRWGGREPHPCPLSLQERGVKSRLRPFSPLLAFPVSASAGSSSAREPRSDVAVPEHGRQRARKRAMRKRSPDQVW